MLVEKVGTSAAAMSRWLQTAANSANNAPASSTDASRLRAFRRAVRLRDLLRCADRSVEGFKITQSRS